MVTAVFILTLLTVIASLASWLFGQWIAGRTRISPVALAVGGGGAMLLIGSVAFAVIGATTWGQRLIPVQDFSPLIAPAAPLTPAEAESVERQAELQAVERHLKRRAEMLALAERHLELNAYAEAVDVARKYLADHPGDADMSSLLARSLFAAEHPGSASANPAAVAQWSSTACVASTRSDESARWMLDNGCGRVVAVLFASCWSGETACLIDSVASQEWSYEPTGILMTAANDRPVPLRLGKGGPLIAPLFTIRDDAGTRRRIRYLACEVTAPAVLELLRASRGEELTQQRLTAELRADACYSQVLDWSRSGQRSRRSPEALLRSGID